MLILVGIFILSLVQVFLPLSQSKMIIRGDGVGYYAYLRSLYFDHDLDFRNEFSYFESILPDKERPKTTQYLLGPSAKSGLIYNPWPIGPAILWTPFFLIAHFLASIFGAPADGYSLPYHLAIAFGSSCYAFIGLVIIYKICRTYFSRAVSTLSILLLWFASSVTAYMYFITSMSHSCSLFTVSLFLYLWQRSRDYRSLHTWVAMGAMIGLTTMIRYQDVFFGLIIPFEILWKLTFKSASQRKVEIKRQILPLLIFGATSFVAFLPQMIVWKIIYGHFLVNVHYQSEGAHFHWTNPKLFETLFSAHHGLISWTPVIGIGLIGLILLRKRDLMLTIAFSILFLVQLYIVASWDYWFQGAAFGGRMFISCGMIFAIGLAALVDRLKKSIPLWPLFLAGGLLTIWNYILLFQYGSGMISRSDPISWLEVLKNIPTIIRLFCSKMISL